jgi:Arc/MetJ-type ribon-helix-helix transcriptional regulator
MITLELTKADAAFLAEQLETRRRSVQNELVHTDLRALRADIARDLDRLDHLSTRLRHALELETFPAEV